MQRAAPFMGEGACAELAVACGTGPANRVSQVREGVARAGFFLWSPISTAMLQFTIRCLRNDEKQFTRFSMFFLMSRSAVIFSRSVR